MRKHSFVLALVVAICTLVSTASAASKLDGKKAETVGTNAVLAQETINFESLPPGQIVSSVFGSGGSGPVLVNGINADLNGLFPGPNDAAVIFDSAAPPGVDFDLGTPNQNFGGPGVGAGGAAGPFANTVAKNHILVVNEASKFIDRDGNNQITSVDSPVTQTNDDDIIGSSLTFDFTAIAPVTVYSLYLIDNEADEVNIRVELYNSGGTQIGATFVGPHTGNNGVFNLPLGPAGVGTPGVFKAVVRLDGSGGIDDFVFAPTGPFCGNGVVDPGEECDDGNTVGGDSCPADCQFVCGDGIVTPPEQCDDQNTNNNDACSNNCTQGCGNGIINTGEQCDDANTNNNDACPNNCRIVCGDGIVTNPPEQCDDGNQNDNDACGNDCLPNDIRCGNGVLDPGETCDDGNLNDNDTCSNNCTAGCGNGIVNTGEQCDDGNTNNNDACSNNCTAGCGNGIINTGEQCDDGNLNNNDYCTNYCLLPVCGDGIKSSGEQCDDGNQENNDACSNNCTRGCGNGIVNTGEMCDDGNTNNNDLCSNNCSNGCGNGIVNTGEQCDDSNLLDNDYCSNNCTGGCGNSIVNYGEQCDDGNTVDTDTCSNNCTGNCGNGVVNTGEACDDGNLNNMDACSNNCTNGCGNGYVNTGEQCDDGNLLNNDYCSNNCTGGCGNGVVNYGEVCDDGNPVDTDNCSNNCTRGCGNGVVNVGENCDDGNNNNNDACSNNCTTGCGNGFINPGEACDDGNTINTDLCSNDCTGGCGNGVTNLGEFCDDGNQVNADGCSNNCTNGCGNGFVNTGEQCDDGNTNNNDACSNNCTQGCGNGITNTGETCDDGNQLNNDYCSNNCTGGCGNGIVNYGERCDDGNTDNNDTCSNNCTNGCGNGVVNTGETCDDGNTVNNDACSNDCTNSCGNGVVNPPEQCDDGNILNNDLCSNNCTGGCGNGIVNTGETCDDGNQNNDDGCRNNCTNGPLCGNGVIDPPQETCDDANTNNNDACSNDCSSGCGNGIINTGEECDDGNTNNNDSCNNTCHLCECGDGVMCAGEMCDDGNTNNNDTCSNNCTTGCGNGIVNFPPETCDDGNQNNNDACSNNCTMGCGNGIVNEGEDCDDGNANNNDTCPNNCLFSCAIDVQKTCEVETGEDGGVVNNCIGKLTSIKFEYTGEGCGASNNPQAGKATCTGGSGGAQPVTAKMTSSNGSSTYGQAVLNIGDVLTATAANAGLSQFGSQSTVTINNGLEVLSIHTSCSQRLSVGDKFGSMEVVEMTTTGSGTNSHGSHDSECGHDSEGHDSDGDGHDTDGNCGGPGGPSKVCTLGSATPPHCVGKIETLSTTYVGGTCADSHNDMAAGKFLCSGSPGNAEPVRIKCYAGSAVYLDTGSPANVTLGDVVVWRASNAGETQMATNTVCDIFDQNGGSLQTLTIHTSCSQPINLGDRFGSLEIFGIDTTSNPPVSIETQVKYRYVITNNSNSPVTNVTVEDDKLGTIPGSPIPSIPPGGSVQLTATALLTDEVTNTVTAEGSLASGATCSDTDSAQVVAGPISQPQTECDSAIRATTLRYTGPNVAGPVTLTVVARNFESQPVVYDFPGGLTTGLVITSPGEHNFTIDATAHGQTKLGTKITLTINGVSQVIHTSCSKPYIVGQPAPIDGTGAPSQLWKIEAFTDQD